MSWSRSSANMWSRPSTDGKNATEVSLSLELLILSSLPAGLHLLWNHVSSSSFFNLFLHLECEHRRLSPHNESRSRLINSVLWEAQRIRLECHSVRLPRTDIVLLLQLTWTLDFQSFRHLRMVEMFISHRWMVERETIRTEELLSFQWLVDYLSSRASEWQISESLWTMWFDLCDIHCRTTGIACQTNDITRWQCNWNTTWPSAVELVLS